MCLGPATQKQTFLVTLGLMEYRRWHLFNLIRIPSHGGLYNGHQGVGLGTTGYISSVASLTALRSCTIWYFPLGFFMWRMGALQADWHGLIKPCITGAMPNKASQQRGCCFLLGHVCPSFRWIITGLAPTACPTKPRPWLYSWEGDFLYTGRFLLIHEHYNLVLFV